MIALTVTLERAPITVDMITPQDNRDILNSYRDGYSFAPVSGRINLLKTNSKLGLDAGNNVAVFGLSLNPADTHGNINTCVWSTPGCRDACILFANYQRADNVQNSRRTLVDYLSAQAADFINHLAWEIELLLAEHGDGNVAIRLNVASDLRWEKFAPGLFDKYGKRVMFYDYTKAPPNQRVFRDDYTLVYSVSERDSSVDNAREYLAAGHSATMVVPIRYVSKTDKDDIPAKYRDSVADHDRHDVRALDKGKLGILRAKGSARTDETGFVRPLSDIAAIIG